MMHLNDSKNLLPKFPHLPFDTIEMMRKLYENRSLRINIIGNEQPTLRGKTSSVANRLKDSIIVNYDYSRNE